MEASVTITLKEYEDLKTGYANLFEGKITKLSNLEKKLEDKRMVTVIHHDGYANWEDPRTHVKFSDSLEELVKNMTQAEFKHMKKVWRNRNN